MACLMLCSSIVFEIAGTVFLKISDGMTRLGPAIGVIGLVGLNVGSAR